MTRPAPNKTPAWTGRSVPLLSEEGFAEALERLEAKIVALEALAKTPPKGAAALGDLVRMADEARDLGVSLRTVCRARQSSNAADTLPGTRLSSVKRLSFRLEEASGGILSAVRELPDEVRARAPFEAWLSPLVVRGSQSSSLFEAVMLPLGSQQSHLVATMKLRIPSEDGHMISLSYAQATSVLKTSPDNRFRRSVFALFNAWFAEHSAAFADLLNAVLGWKLHEAHAAGRDFMTAAFEADRITPAAQLAMMKALELRRENARLTITERARLLGERQLHVTQILGSVEGMHASAPEGLNGLDEVCGSLSSAMACTDPAFGRYLEEALENHWIDARSMSQRAGGTWCEDLPAYNATAVFSTLPSGTAGAFQFAHPLGVGFMHKAQHGEQAPLKRLPYSVIEIFGQLAVTMLERHMARKLEGSTEADLLRWQLMRRASNMLLMVPSRHKLLVDLLAARRDGILSASRFNEASRRAWDAFFGGTTDGCDQYVWCWKPHLYRTNTVFYDWQYAFGYLVSQHLAETFLTSGTTASGASLGDFARDACRMRCDELIKKHLDADIRDPVFWTQAIDTALARCGLLPAGTGLRR